MPHARVIAVVLEDGTAIRARTVVSNLNPKLLYGQLIDASVLDRDFRERIGHWRCGSGTFRMNVALTELPDFNVLPGKSLADHHTSGIIMAPSLAYMGQAYPDAKAGGWSKRSIVEMLIPSTLGSLAPPGRHVASLFCQHVAPVLPDGASWDDHREHVARTELQGVGTRPADHEPARFRTHFRVDRWRHLPRRLESRPTILGEMLGHSDYRGPLHGLYTCGSGRHPGGGVTGAPVTTRRARSLPTSGAGD